MQKVVLSTLALATMLLEAAPALGCSYMGAPEPVGYPSSTFLSKGLFEAATFVDLAVAESSRPLAGPGNHFGTHAITFRVIQRWKGRSPDRFQLFGQALHPDGMAPPSWVRHHWVDELGRVVPHATPVESPTAPLTTMSSCDPGFIRPAAGRTYVIFREADGRLLGPVLHHPGTHPQRGLEFVEVTNPREDEWLGAAFLRSFDYSGGAGQVAVTSTPAADRALVLFARPLDAAAAAAILRRAGVRPFAVHAAAGDFLDEQRLPSDRAALPFLDEALAAVRENMNAQPSRAAARQLLPGLTAEELERDSWKRAFAAALILAEERRAQAAAAGPPLIAGVEVLGEASAWAALRRDPRVARLEQGFVLRGRAAVPAPPGREALATPRQLDEQARSLSPAFLFHQLRVLAGELPPTDPAPPRTTRTER